MCIQAEASFLPFRTNLRSCCCLANYILQAKASFVPFLHHRAQYLLFILYYKQYTQKLSFSHFCINLSSFCCLKHMYSSRSFISPFLHQFTKFLLLGKLYIRSKSFICSFSVPMCAFLLFILYYKQYKQKLSISYFCINLSSFCYLKKYVFKQKLNFFLSAPIRSFCCLKNYILQAKASTSAACKIVYVVQAELDFFLSLLLWPSHQTLD
jgi:hypothetical protein